MAHASDHGEFHFPFIHDQRSIEHGHRLGVGAATTEVLQASRDAAKLKGQLLGKKRAREQAEEQQEKGRNSDDEGESRAGAIKKKIKVDPFGPKKKKASATLLEAKPTAASQSHTPAKQAPAQRDEAVAEDDAKPVAVASTSSKKKKRKKKHTAPADELPSQSNNTETADTPTTPSSSKVALPSPVSPKETRPASPSKAPRTFSSSCWYVIGTEGFV